MSERRGSAGRAGRELRAFVALGSNLGDRAGFLRAAIADLDARVDTRVSRLSSWYETRPIGAASRPFLNGVLELHSTLTPASLMSALLAIESAHGRTRTGMSDDRTLDLDLLCAFRNGSPLLVPARPGEASSLTLPHPRMCERDFVLVPLAELDPELLVDGIECARRAAELPTPLRTILARLPGEARGLRSPSISC